MDIERRLWNQKQKELRRVLTGADDHSAAIELFLSQHAAVHSTQVSRSEVWSFADEIWQDLTEEEIRTIPRKGDHSIAWVIWHMARIEDVTMNILVAGSPQILHRDNWFEQMKTTFQDTGNAMDQQDVTKLSGTIDIEMLRAYRLEVGRRTREIAAQLQPEDLKQKVEPARLERVMDEGAVVEEARGLRDYWGKRKIAGLLLMPPTRHNFIHLNEGWRVKQKLKMEGKQ